jgi:hypothetical protein
VSATFDGAMLPVCGVDVLVVAVQPWVLADPHESQLYVIGFQLRFGRTVVLMARDADRVPTFYGPAPIARALGRLPFDLIPWRRYPYRLPRPRTWQLPIPADPQPAVDLESRCGRTLVLDRHSATLRVAARSGRAGPIDPG